MLATISNEYYPYALAVSKKLTGGVAALNIQLINYAKACVKPAHEYFELKFGVDLALAVSVFKCARIFDPAKVVELKPTGSDVDSLRVFPFLNSDSILDGLKHELPTYTAAAEDVSPAIDRIGWWRGTRMTSLIGQGHANTLANPAFISSR